MKYLFIVVEGIADFPSKIFDDRTPLDLARTPWLDKLTYKGRSGLSRNIPSFCVPGSDVGFLSLLGYNPSKIGGGKGFFEAKGLGLDTNENEIAFRINLVTEKDGLLVSCGASSISDDECMVIADALNDKYKQLPVKFYSLSGYRLLMIADSKWLFEGKKNNLKTFAPQKKGKFLLKELYPSRNGSQKLISLQEEISIFLAAHEINHVKIDLGESPANAVMIWGHQKPSKMKSFQEMHGMNAICIPSTHLIRGIAVAAGLDAVPVFCPHSKNPYDVFPRRIETAMQAFDEYNCVIIHIETIDDISLSGDLQRKCQAIESFDDKVVGRMVEFLEKTNDFRILVAVSHASSIEKASIDKSPAPWVAYGTGIKRDNSERFTEKDVRSSLLSDMNGSSLLKKTLFKK